MHRILRIAVLVPLFLVVLTPLIILPGAPFPYVTGKAIWFRFMVELALLPWLALLVWRKISIPWTKTTVFLTAFVILALISDFRADYPVLAIFSNVERMEGGIAYVFLLVWYLMMASVMDQERIRRAWLWSLIAAGVALEGYVFTQWGPNLEQPTSTLGNASYVGQFCAMLTFLALSLQKEVMPHSRAQSAQNNDKYPPPAMIIALGAAFLCILATFAAQSRGGLLALAAGGIVYCFGSLGGTKRGLAVLALAGLAAGLLAYLDTPLWLRLVTLGAWDNRPDIWWTAIEMAKVHPILGWGQDHFRYAFDQFTTDQSLLHHVDRAHNLVLDRLVSGGILGLYAWGGFLMAIRREAVESAGPPAGIYAFLAAYAVSDLTLFDTLPTYLLLIGMAAITAQRSRAPYRVAKKPPAPVRAGQRQVNVTH